ncbi:MAG: histidinol-phosphate transaminase [Candidatus Altiarchaeales archaeon ex4484_96]|nr:MAG: histidinol-phosphate transaminase [Candidatus Altiarchaeales archaeon ex4484_96]
MKSELNNKVKKHVYDIKPYVPGNTVENYIKLASNENNYGPSPKVVEALKDYADKVNVYPHLDDEVRIALSGYCGVEENSIIAGNGSDELIELILKVFRGPVLYFNPTFGEYLICARILGEKTHTVNLREDFSFPLEEYLIKAREAGVLFLCSPNNPTGTVIPKEDIIEILELGKPTVVDEAYIEFGGESVISLLDEYENLIIPRTFSKAFALGGLRIGYAISSPQIIELLLRVKQPFSVNCFAQKAAVVALEDVAFMRKNVAKIIEDRRLLYDRLSAKYRAYKSNANFVLVDSTPLSAQQLYDRLYERKIIVRKLGVFPGFKGDYTRISVGTSRENQILLEALDEI